jgi:hypothetical protein
VFVLKSGEEGTAWATVLQKSRSKITWQESSGFGSQYVVYLEY